MKIKLALIDDEVLFRRSLKLLFSSNHPEIEIVFEAGNGKEFLRYLDEGKNMPDVILLDIRMPELDGIQVVKRLLKANEEFSNLNIIVLTSLTSDYMKDFFFSVGVSGFVQNNLLQRSF